MVSTVEISGYYELCAVGIIPFSVCLFGDFHHGTLGWLMLHTRKEKYNKKLSKMLSASN